MALFYFFISFSLNLYVYVIVFVNVNVYVNACVYVRTIKTVWLLKLPVISDLTTYLLKIIDTIDYIE